MKIKAKKYRIAAFALIAILATNACGMPDNNGVSDNGYESKENNHIATEITDETSLDAEDAEPELEPEIAAQLELENAVFQYPMVIDGICVDVYDSYIAVTGFEDDIIQNYAGTIFTLNIPEEIEDLPVRVIAEGAFARSAADVKYIVAIGELQLPDTLYLIEDDAFRNQYLLSQITIPDSVFWIGESAFSNGYKKIMSTNIDLGNNVVTIGNYAFANMGNVGTLVIPDSVELIGESAFSNCGITDIQFGNGVWELGYAAFYDNSLSSVVIPESVEIIGGYLFNNNPDLAEVSILSTGVFFDVDMSTNFSKRICDIFEGCSKNLVVKGKAGSSTAKYCSDYGHKFSLIKD